MKKISAKIILYFGLMPTLFIASCSDREDPELGNVETNTEKIIAQISGLWESYSVTRISNNLVDDYAGNIYEPDDDFKLDLVFKSYDPNTGRPGQGYRLNYLSEFIWSVENRYSIGIVNSSPTFTVQHYSDSSMGVECTIKTASETFRYRVSLSKSSKKEDMYDPARLAGEWTIIERVEYITDSQGNIRPINRISDGMRVGYVLQAGELGYMPGTYFIEYDPEGNPQRRDFSADWFLMYDYIGLYTEYFPYMEVYRIARFGEGDLLLESINTNPFRRIILTKNS